MLISTWDAFCLWLLISINFFFICSLTLAANNMTVTYLYIFENDNCDLDWPMYCHLCSVMLLGHITVLSFLQSHNLLKHRQVFVSTTPLFVFGWKSLASKVETWFSIQRQMEALSRTKTWRCFIRLRPCNNERTVAQSFPKRRPQMCCTCVLLSLCLSKQELAYSSPVKLSMRSSVEIGPRTIKLEDLIHFYHLRVSNLVLNVFRRRWYSPIRGDECCEIVDDFRVTATFGILRNAEQRDC
jgi:hypothetical protein